MLGIVFTTSRDASPFLDRHVDDRIDRVEEGAPVQLDDLLVAITGPGKIKATLATERLLRTHDLDAIVHAGRCTGLSEDLSTGAIVGASFVLEGDRVELDAPTYPRMPLTCPYDVDVEGTVVSQDHAPDAGDDLNYWARLADVRDSTGYPVAYVAAQHGTPCHVTKVVADHIEADSDTVSRESLTVLAEFLERVAEAPSPSSE